MVACSVLFISSCTSIPTGRERIIDPTTGETADRGQVQVQERPYVFGIPMPWKQWINKKTAIERIVSDIKAPVKLVNVISLWATIALGAIAVSVQTPPFNTIARRAGYVMALVYGASIALLFAFGFIVEFWWVFLILLILVLAFVFKDRGIKIGKPWKATIER